jgi:Flp pilus assembly secretin CpaC
MLFFWICHKNYYLDFASLGSVLLQTKFEKPSVYRSSTKIAEYPEQPKSTERSMTGNLAKLALAAAMLCAASSMSMAVEAPEGAKLGEQPVIVTVDRAKVFRLSRPAATVIIGNPAIADATVEDEQTLVLTGRSFGVTNIVILDAAGEAIIDQSLVVRGHETNTVRIYRRADRETLACAPVCEPTLTIGDDSTAFNYASSQISARNALSEAAGGR